MIEPFEESAPEFMKFTERAKRVIFFARYEASQGSGPHGVSNDDTQREQ